MKLPYLKPYSLIIILAVIIIPYSCKKDTSVPPATTSVSGVVTDIDKTPVSNATVTGGTATTTTDANGKFTLTKVQFTADSVLVNVTKDGFFQGSKNFGSTTGTVNNATIRLIPKPAAATITASSGGDVTVPGGGSVSFTGGFVNASNGSAYTGNVSVSSTYLNSTDQNFTANVPGNLKGVSASNQPGILQSFGVVVVEMNDVSGNKLQLAPGKTATITIPIASSLQGSAPATIPLWYFDDVKGWWKEEGTATKQGSNYVGVVTHFSFWNAGDLAGSVDTAQVDIYVAGAEYNLSLSSFEAKYWKNGQAIALGSGIANSIAVVGSDVYVAGYNGSVAKYWNNGQVTSLTDGTQYSRASSIAVAGSDVYVAGYDGSVAKYWKNGQGIPLGDSAHFSFASSIVVLGGDVYVVGYDSTEHVAKCWKNGTAIALGDGANWFYPSSIAVAGSDVYVAGSDGSVAKYLKNGQAITLTDGTQHANANSIAVVGSDVYVAGSDGSIAKYWKNGQAMALTDGTHYAAASSIAVVGSDIYVAGYEENGFGSVAKYWKDGQATTLTDGTNQADAMGIVVIKP